MYIVLLLLILCVFVIIVLAIFKKDKEHDLMIRLGSVIIYIVKHDK
mgnify:CR=1